LVVLDRVEPEPHMVEVDWNCIVGAAVQIHPLWMDALPSIVLLVAIELLLNDADEV